MASDPRRWIACNVTRALALSLAVVSVFGQVDSTRAVTITANGSRQFYDDFEDALPGNNPGNGMKLGHWAIQGTILPVCDGATPGPVQGKHYLSVTRALPGEPGWYNDLVAQLASEQGLYNVRIHAEWMMYVPLATPATYRATILFDQSSENIRTGLVLGDGATGKVDYLGPDGEYRTAKSAYTPDVWQKWTMDYTVGESQFTFSIGNGPPETVDAHTAGGVAGLHFCGNHKVGSVFYLDAAEAEPATTVLLITGQDTSRTTTPAKEEQKAR